TPEPVGSTRRRFPSALALASEKTRAPRNGAARGSNDLASFDSDNDSERARVPTTMTTGKERICASPPRRLCAVSTRATGCAFRQRAGRLQGDARLRHPDAAHRPLTRSVNMKWASVVLCTLLLVGCVGEARDPPPDDDDVEVEVKVDAPKTLRPRRVDVS